MRQTTAFVFLCALIPLACTPRPPRPAEPPPVVQATTWPARPAVPAPPPKAKADGSAIMATVNGRPIYMRQLHEPLVEAHGLLVAEMLIADAIVAQEAHRRRITVTDQDVAAENDYWLGKISGAFKGDLDPDQRQRLLDQLLLGRGLTRSLWRGTMERNVRLRKMVAPEVVVTEAMLKAEFARRYGEKVRVRHVQVATYADAEKVIALLKKGEDFAALARRYSTDTKTASTGGTLPPFTRANTGVPQAIRDAAFALRGPGQTSGVVQVGSTFHVLKLDQRVAPAGVDYPKVKDRLGKELRGRLIERLQSQLLSRLRAKAEVEYINRALRQAVKRRSRP